MMRLGLVYLFAPFVFLLFSQSLVTAKGVDSIGGSGFCCVKGVLQSGKTESQCKKQRGTYYSAKQASKAKQQCRFEQGFCCVKDKLQSGKTELQCKKQHGSYFPAGQASKAKRQCRPERGFCCVKGVLQSGKTESQCRKQRGTYFSAKQASKAKKQCRSEQGFCCVKDKLQSGKTESQCKKQRGSYYPADQASKAKRQCRPERGFCCVKGKLQSGKTESQCKKQGGIYYSAKQAEKARRACRAENGLCCVNGKLLSNENEKECLKKRGKFFSKGAARQAKMLCQPEGYCNSNGKISELTRKNCENRGGEYFDTRARALQTLNRKKIDVRVSPAVTAALARQNKGDRKNPGKIENQDASLIVEVQTASLRLAGTGKLAESKYAGLYRLGKEKAAGGDVLLERTSTLRKTVAGSSLRRAGGSPVANTNPLVVEVQTSSLHLSGTGRMAGATSPVVLSGAADTLSRPKTKKPVEELGVFQESRVIRAVDGESGGDTPVRVIRTKALKLTGTGDENGAVRGKDERLR